MFDNEEPITAAEYKEVARRLEAKGFGSTPIEEALLDCIKRIGQKVEHREKVRENARNN